MIRELLASDILGLNSFPPMDWKFDYEYFLEDNFGEDYFRAFVLIKEDEIIGTGNVFLKDKVGWLANIMVAEKYRGKGFGFEISKFLVGFLSNKGCETLLLIATELGELVYRKLGFEKITDYHSFATKADYDFRYYYEFSG